MVGRANRASGAGQGRVFVTAQNTMRPETDMTYIERADRLREDDIGPNIIRGLVVEWPKAPSGVKTNMFGVFHKFGWKKTRQQFEKITFPQVKTLLRPHLNAKLD